MMNRRVTAVLTLLVLGVAGQLTGNAATRTPWTSSKVQGSPEPPPAYTTERIYPAVPLLEPVGLYFEPLTNWVLVVEHMGKLRAFPNRPSADKATVIADFSKLTGPGGEAFSIVFHPGFATNRLVFAALLSKQPKRSMGVWRMTMKAPSAPDAPPQVDLDGAVRLLDWWSDGHNGCDLHFGPEGFLYVSAGDGAAPAPPDSHKTGQSIDDLMSSILRIDVDHLADGKAYSVPKDNPFVNRPGARPEVWAYGFRNPWRMAFDPRDGALWIGDVGWEAWEMLFRVPSAGFNGGWSIMEGPMRVNSTWPVGPTPIQPPLWSYPHTEGASITGGRFYRGRALPELRDHHVFGDYESGKIWSILWRDGAVVSRGELTLTTHRVVSFANDLEGEVCYTDLSGGGIHRLVRNTTKAVSGSFPRLLSEAGLFRSIATLDPAPGVEPYRIAAPSWADHARADLSVAIPGTATASTRDKATVPDGTVFMRTLTMEMKAGDPASARHIETQLLHFERSRWNAYTYRWNDGQTDAELVPKEGAEKSLIIDDPAAPGGRREQNWRFQSRTECFRCHLDRFGTVVSFIPQQLAAVAGGAETELGRLKRLGVIDGKTDAGPWNLASPHDASAPLDLRARSWLHANCGHCHRRDANASVMIQLHGAVTPAQMFAIDVAPSRGGFGLTDAKIVAPGAPENSALLYRAATTASGRMPIVGSSVVDEPGLALLSRWVESLGATNRSPRPARDAVLATQVGTPSAAMALALNACAVTPSSTQRARLAELAEAASNPAARDLLERFLPAAKRRRVLGIEPAPELILSRQGDAVRGRELFLGAGGPQCQTCHRHGGEGREVGPDLTAAGTKFNRAALLDQILHPAKQVDEVWRTHEIETIDGNVRTGFVVSRDAGSIRFRAGDGALTVIPIGTVRREGVLPGSMMPEGLLQALTAQEAADLLEFIAPQR